MTESAPRHHRDFHAGRRDKWRQDQTGFVTNSAGALRDGNLTEVEADIRAVVKAAQGHVVKVILETCLLSDEEIVVACHTAEIAGADFVKTSTGFSKNGATPEAVALMKKTVGDRLGVKASGGIRDRKTLLQMIEAGATRIGTSSGIALLEAVVAECEH